MNTTGIPISFTAAAAWSRSETTRARGVGIPCRRQNSLVNTLLPSSSAAARDGPTSSRPRRANSSAMPRTSGSSGPTTVRSTLSDDANSASSTVASAAIGTQVAMPAIPGFPGAA